jgi:hypothetical protein
MKVFKRLKEGAQSIYREHQKNKKRSPRWALLRKAHLLFQPKCMVCDSSIGVQVHHIMPFNEDPSQELNPNNLISLCVFNLCHSEIGHGDNFRYYNPVLLDLISIYKQGLITREELEIRSKKVRLPNDG